MVLLGLMGIWQYILAEQVSEMVEHHKSKSA